MEIKQILKFIRNHRRLHITNTILNIKNKSWDSYFPISKYFKYFKALLQQCARGIKDRYRLMEQTWKPPKIYVFKINWALARVSEDHNGERTVSLIKDREKSGCLYAKRWKSTFLLHYLPTSTQSGKKA